MLPKLLMRDALLHGRMLLISYGIFAAFQLYFVLRVDSSRFWLVAATIYASFLAITVFAREDKFQSTAWTCTLPVSRRAIVQARFVEAWILVAASLAIATLVAAVLPGSRVDVSAVVQTDALLLAATVVTLVVSLMLPFLVRFGLLGVLIFLVAMQVIGSGLLVVTVMLGNRDGGRVNLGLHAIAGAVRAAHAALPPVVFDLLAVALLFVVNWLGYRLAVFFFDRREL